MKKRKLLILMIIIAITIASSPAFAVGLDTNMGNLPNVQNPIVDSQEQTADLVDSVKIMMFLTVLTLAPSFLILTTSFARIIIVLSFLRNALGTQQSPPNMLLIGLSLFLTLFIMQPVYTAVMEDAVTPYMEESIEQDEAMEIAGGHIKKFMLKQTREKDLALFLRASNSDNVEDPMDIKLTTVIPAFALSELKTAFTIGFIIFIPFLVIDMVVSSILMSMGMFMLPPVMISLPFKVLLFVLVDGWYLVVESLMESFI